MGTALTVMEVSPRERGGAGRPLHARLMPPRAGAGQPGRPVSRFSPLTPPSRRRAACRGQVPEPVDRTGAAEQVALRLLARLFPQEGELAGRLDALGQDRQAEAAAEAEHRAHDRRRLLARVDGAGEGGIDLDLVERKGAQVRQGRVAGAEIVHGDPHPHRLDPPQGRERPRQVADQRRLGDLELEAGGLEAVVNSTSWTSSAKPAAWSWTAETFTAMRRGLSHEAASRQVSRRTHRRDPGWCRSPRRSG